MEKEFNILEAAEELTAESGADESTDLTNETGGQPEGANENQNQEVGLEEIIKDLGKEEPKQADELTQKLNELGLVHDGKPISLESMDQVKELIQKGYDYTKKTMALSEESKLKQEEFAQAEAKFKEREEQLTAQFNQHSETLRDSEIFVGLINKWKTEDPELFNFLAAAYSQELSRYQQEQAHLAKHEGKFKELNEKIESLVKSKEQDQLGDIKKGWEKELGEVQAKTGATLSKLGVKADWDKVKAAWTADATNSLTVEQALYAVHGPEIQKAYDSHKKLLATKNKVQTNLINRSGIGNGVTSEEPMKKVAVGDYDSILRN